MESTILDQLVLPLALFVIMLGMGLSLQPADFRKVLDHPRAFALGFVCQMIALPLFGLLIVSVIPMSPALAVGIMILSFCPGGASSNLIAFLAKGDIALSVSLTAVVSVLTPFTIPLFTGWSIDHFMGEQRTLEFPVLKTIGKLLLISLLPVAIGMIIRRFQPKAAAWAEQPVKIFSALFLFAIIALITIKNWADIPAALRASGPACLILNLGTMSMGYFAARRLLDEHKQAISIGVEVGIQNGTMALLVTNGILHNAEMSIPPAIYSLFMFISGFGFAMLVNRGAEECALAPTT